MSKPDKITKILQKLLRGEIFTEQAEKEIKQLQREAWEKALLHLHLGEIPVDMLLRESDPVWGKLEQYRKQLFNE